MRCASSRRHDRRQQGAVLVVSLVLLLILTMIGVTVARMQTVEERMARNEQNRALALQAAEATLRDVEGGVGAIYVDFAQNANGLYTLIAADGATSDAWMNGTMVAGPTTVLSYAGAALASVPLAAPPQFIIEQMPPVAAPGDSLGNQGGYNNPQPPVQIFRIPAQAVGGDGTTTATVQSLYRH
jgi:type IV pilus assembly protein PilX